MFSLNIQIQIKMASTQRTEEDQDDKKHQRLHDRSQTMHLEKILLSSSSTSSNNKIQTQSTHNLNRNNIHLTVTSQHMQSVDNQSGASNMQLNGGQYTYRGVAFNNTGKNWRKLITPAHDSFKKLQQMQPEYSGQDLGKGLNNQQNTLNGAISNDTSMNTSSDHYSSVKEFNPATNEMLQLRTFNQPLNTHTTNTAGKSMIEIEEASSSSSEEYKTGNHRFLLPSTTEDHQKSNLQGSMGEFGVQSEHMKSLMKSFSNGNFGFYENLHKKYYDKAKQDVKSKSDKEDVFTLTSKTSTILGLSQLKQSIQSLKTSHNNQKSQLRTSSLQKPEKENQSSNNQKTMSINFKNSLFKKINTTSVFLDNQSQLQSKINSKSRNGYFDASSSSSDEECDDSQQRLVTQDSRIRGRSHNVRRARSKNKQQNFIKDNFEDDLIDEKFHSMLSRRDLSANHDETQSHLDQRMIKTPRDFIHDLQLKSKQDRDSSLQNLRVSNNIPRHQNFGRDISPNSANVDGFYHQGLNSILSSSEQNQKMLLLMSNHQNDFINQQHQHHGNDTTNVIFEQPTREEEMGDTLGVPPTNAEELRPEDLSQMIDQAMGMQSSQMSNGNLSQSTGGNNDVLKTFQEYCKIARQRQANQQFQTNQKKNGMQSSQYAYGGGVTPALLNMNSDKQSIHKSNANKGSSVHHHQIPQSAAPANRHQPLNSANRPAIQTTNSKKGEDHHHLSNPMMFMNNNAKNNQQQQLDQRSDFTFVLSNPTDFECQCGENNTSSSFITQKHQRLLQNSSQQSFLRLRQHPQQHQKQQLPDIPASPIYSEHQCHNCGQQRRQQLQQKLYQVNESIIEQPIEEANDQEQQQRQQKKVFEYKEGGLSEQESDRQQQQDQQYQMEEEIKFLRLIMNVSHEYLQRILLDYQIAQPMRQELQKFTQLLSQLAVNQSQGSAMQMIQEVTKEKGGQQDGTNNNLVDANMTMSELQLQNDSQLGQCNTKIVNETKLSELVVMGEDEHETTNKQVKQNVTKKRKQSKKETGKFISSLISQGDEGQNHQQEDTVYSYLEDEEGESSDQSLDRDDEDSLKKSLRATKKMLKQEKMINREQQEMLKKMQAEIEALNHRWMMTEEKIRAGENAYHILSRTTTSHFNHASHHNYRSAAVITPIVGLTSTIGSNQVTNSNTNQKRDVSPGQQSGNTHKHMQSHTLTNPVTPSSAACHQHSQLELSSHPLIHLNERLTRQIEDNLHLFDSLNQELSQKQAALLQGEAILSEKDREVRRLKGQLKTMDENMRSLIEVTKLTSEATEASKARHRDEMDKIKKRQIEYQNKIHRIQSVCGIDSVMSIGQIATNSASDSENVNPNRPNKESVLSGSFMKDSAKKEQLSEINDSSALLKYSQDVTGSQLVLSGKQQQQQPIKV